MLVKFWRLVGILPNWSHRFKAMIHSFPTCISWGGAQDGLNQDFRLKSRYKNMNINLDYLTSEWSGTPVFKRVAYFDICSLITLFLGSDTKNGKNFFAIRPITWNFDTATHIQGTTIWNLSSWQSSKNNGFLSTPFWPAWTEKRKSILLKKKKKTQLPLVAIGRIQSLWEAEKTWQRHLTELAAEKRS